MSARRSSAFSYRIGFTAVSGPVYKWLLTRPGAWGVGCVLRFGPGRAAVSFRFVTADDQGHLYAVTATGDLLYYRDEARDGTSRWSFGGVGQAIG